MSNRHADRNLLFGILALQMDFISRDGLVQGMNAWVLDKQKSLGQVLVEREALSRDRHALLEALVQEHLKQHGNDPQKSLAAVSSLASARQDLEQVADPDMQASLAHVPGTRGPGEDSPPTRPPSQGTAADGDPHATQAPSLGSSSGSGQRFRILRPHARGGLGEVFVAEDEELHREVALKEIQSRHAHQPDSRSRFLLEAEVTGRLEHPGIVPVYGLGTYADGRPYYAMRFIKGDSLQEAIERFHRPGEGKDPGQRGLELRQLLGRFVDVCNAVAYAHSRGVLHRDLKPGNIMLGQYGETLVVDWGLAKMAGRVGAGADSTEAPLAPTSGSGVTPTQMGQAIGTPQYMSPEQAAGRLDELGPASDVYSLGATLYALLTGRAPFAGQDLGLLLRQVQRGDFPPPRQVNPDVPRPLEAVCLKAMGLRPQDRYASAKDLAGDVERWLADEPVAAYREPRSARLRRWGRRHRTLVSTSVALLLTIAVALGVSTVLISGALQKEEQARGQAVEALHNEELARSQAVEALKKEERARKERALAQVNALLDAGPQAVPAILQGLEPLGADVLPALHVAWEAKDTLHARARRMRASLALLSVEPDKIKSPLFDWMLQVEDPAEMLLLRNRLRPYGADLRPRLWERADDARSGPGARFRALVALAAFDPGSARWEREGELAVERLLAANPLHLGLWTEALRPVKASLLRPLGEVFRGKKLAERREVAATVLADYASDRPDVLADLIADADPKQYALLLPLLQGHGEQAVALLSRVIERSTAPDAQDRVALASRQANAVVALLQLGDAERVWPLLRHSSYPDRRSYLVARLAPLGRDAWTLVKRLEEEPDVTARRALVLALGEYTAEQLPAELRARLVPRLLDWYRSDPDPGLHGAIDWLLRHGREGPEPRKLDWGQAAALSQADEEQRGKEPPKDRRWYVNKTGQTLAVFPGPVEFLMGSPGSEPGRDTDEKLHRRRIGRSFALATKPVTVAQFQKFLHAHPEVKHSYLRQYSPEPGGPIISVTWYEAAQYCRWLSEQEGVPEEQMCYPPVEVIEKSKDATTPLKLPADYLRRTGYRLPTEAEWEYACRAGTRSSRSYGSGDDLLPRYAWCFSNSQDRTWPVGQKRPNDFGLFDMHGNVWQWCQESGWAYQPGANGQPAEDEEDKRDITDCLSRVLRGGSYDYLPSDVRSAYRSPTRPADRTRTVGLRVARTCH